MKIYIKQISGFTIELDVESDAAVVDIARMAYEKRAVLQKNAIIEDYAKAINLLYSGRTLNWSFNLSHYRIKEGSTINEVGKSWTMASNFDWSSLSVPDHKSGAKIDEPYMLNPGCADVINKAYLHSIANQPENLERACPSCNKEIDPSHFQESKASISSLLKFMLVNSTPKQVGQDLDFDNKTDIGTNSM